MLNVKCFSIAIMPHFDPLYKSIGRGINRKAGSLLSFDIQATMKMVASQFSETTGEDHFNVEWIAEIISR